MKKYLQVAQIGLREILEYRFDVITNNLMTIVKLVLSFILWSSIFTAKEMVGGYTLAMMMTYYIFVSFLSSLDKSEDVSNQLSEEIRMGNFTKYLSKPLNLIGYFFSYSLSKTAFTLVTGVVIHLIWFLIFSRYFVGPASLGLCLCAAAIFLLGFLFLHLLNLFLTLLTFWLQNVSAFFLFKHNVIELFTGTLIPLSLLPAGIAGFFRLTPFYYAYYYPVALYFGQEQGEIPLAFAVLAVWIALMFILDVVMCKNARKAYEGIGG